MAQKLFNSDSNSMRHLNEIILNDENCKSLQEFFDCNEFNPYYEQKEFINYFKFKIHNIPEIIKVSFDSFKNNSHSSYMIIKNCPFDKTLPDTPNEFNSENHERSTFYAESNLLMSSLLLGNPISFSQENNGDLFQNVMSMESRKKSKTSNSSIINLDFHTENSFHPFLLDYLCLVCLKEDPSGQAKTLLVNIDDIFQNNDLTDQEKRVLFESRFTNKIAPSFGYGEEAQLKEPTTICWGSKKSPFIKYSFLMDGIDEDSKKVLSALQKSFNNVFTTSIQLKKGEILVINNKKILHARTKYDPNHPKNNRWLKRIFVKSTDSVNVLENQIIDFNLDTLIK